MSFNRFFVVLLLVAAMAVPAIAEAQTIAVVNIQRIMRDSTAAQSARNQLKSKQQQFQNDIKAKDAELQKAGQELAKQRSLLSKEAFAQEEQKFRQKAAGVQKDVNAKRIQLTKAFDGALGQLQSTVVTIIGEMAKEKGFALAVPSTQTLYYNPSMDITDEVLKRLNSRLTKITINFQ